MAQIRMVERTVRERSGEDRLDELYRAFAPDTRLACLLTGDPGLAEDLAQDAFVRVLGRFRDLRTESFWWYLRKTVVNLSRSYFRRRRVERAGERTTADQYDRHSLIACTCTTILTEEMAASSTRAGTSPSCVGPTRTRSRWTSKSR
jgi:DNA-directed RNA polymerase specialized sigma24 family protein